MNGSQIEREGLRVALLAIASLLAGHAFPADSIGPFHAPAADERRFVIELPPMPDEMALQVELLVGRVLTVDCNARGYLGKLERKKLLGRGLVYYTARDMQIPIEPAPPCPADQPPKEAFVHLEGEPYCVPYDSKTPIVVYTQPEFEVRYRLWSATSETKAAEAK